MEKLSAESVNGAVTNETTDSEPNLNDQNRPFWSNKVEFFLSCLGYTVGFRNIWRFPYLCHKNGGGPFVFAYVFFLLFAGIPLVYLQFSLGQYTSLGAISFWSLAPIFKGLGYAMVITSFFLAVYHSCVISWAFYYLFATMQNSLPWTTCSNQWNMPDCCESKFMVDNCSAFVSDTEHVSSLTTNVTPGGFFHKQNSENPDENQSCYVCVSGHNATENITLVDTTQLTNVSNSLQALFNSPAHQYFINHVLGATPDISQMGTLQWPLVLCLLLVVILTFICLIRGIRSLGKVAYFTTLFPYIILLLLGIRSALMPGAREGIIAFLKPNWNRLNNIQVWYEAASQVFFSLGPCYGTLLTLASHCQFTNNPYRDAMVVSVLDTLTSILAGISMFLTFGFMTKELDFGEDDIISYDWLFGFVLYPTALFKIDGGHAWTVLFYLMVICVGIGTLLSGVHTIVQALVDEFPSQLRKKQIWVLLGTCLLLFLLGLPLTSQGSIHLMRILEYYSTSMCVLAIALVECLIVLWLYGFQRLQHDIWTMVGIEPSRWWRLTWQFVTPVLLALVLAYAIYTSIMSETVSTPVITMVIAAVTVSITLLPVPGYAIFAFITTPGSFRQKCRSLLKPALDRGPSWTREGMEASLLGVPDYMLDDDDKGLDNPAFYDRRESLYSEGSSYQTSQSGLSQGFGAQNGENIDTGSVQWSQDENKERGNWKGRFDFLVSGLGYSIGVGNVWRFPYLVYKNGGGAFFIPYILMLVFCGIPLFFMELAFGQFASLGPIAIWKVSPIFKGVGYACAVTVFFVVSYYNVINAWSVYFFFASMTSELPWSHCNNTWNTPECRPRSALFYNNDCMENDTSTNLTLSWTGNCSANVNKTTYSTPSEEYFFRKVLNLSDGIETPGELQWHLPLCLLFCWVITFIALIRGVKSVGKVVYFTVSFPYIILLVLLIRYVTLHEDAHLDGIKYYVTPNWNRLMESQVWADAASQLFFSLGLSLGGLIGLSSYNRFHYDCLRDAYIVCCMDTLTSVFAGFVVFAILGVMAKEAGTTVENVVTSQFALTYVTYPEAVTRLPFAPLWSVLFFLMLFSLAIDSHFLMVEGFVIAIMDEFSYYLKKKRILVISTLCIVLYILGLPMVSSGGLYVLMLMDSYVGAWSPLIIGILMCVSLSWVYKVKHFCSDVSAMLEKNISWWWSTMWKFVTPGILLFILIFSLVKYEPIQFGPDRPCPLWAEILGWVLSLSSVACIPIVAIVQVFKSRAHCKQAILDRCQPTYAWGPALQKHRDSCMHRTSLPIDSLVRTAAWVSQVTMETADSKLAVDDPKEVFHTTNSGVPFAKSKSVSVTGTQTKLSETTNANQVKPRVKRRTSRVTFKFDRSLSSIEDEVTVADDSTSAPTRRRRKTRKSNVGLHYNLRDKVESPEKSGIIIERAVVHNSSPKTMTSEPRDVLRQCVSSESTLPPDELDSCESLQEAAGTSVILRKDVKSSSKKLLPKKENRPTSSHGGYKLSAKQYKPKETGNFNTSVIPKLQHGNKDSETYDQDTSQNNGNSEIDLTSQNTSDVWRL